MVNPTQRDTEEAPAPPHTAPLSGAKTFSANIPLAVTVGLILLAGQSLQLGSFSALTYRDIAALVFSFVTSSIAVALLCVLICDFPSRLGRTYLSAALWMLAASFSSAYYWDHFGFQWLGLHLSEAIPLLIQNARTDFQVMHAKFRALMAVIAVYVAVLIVGTIVARKIFKRYTIFRRPIRVWALLGVLVTASLGYITEQLLAPYVMTRRAYEARLAAVWEIRFVASNVSGRTSIYTLAPINFKQRPDPQTVERVLGGIGPQKVGHPLNIFLFVIDSLRADYINNVTTPNLFRLKDHALMPRYGVGSGNCTHISWFSIVHAINPLYWSVVSHQAHSDGAIPIRALRNAGYTIKAISTPRLDYFGFAHSAFADGEKLATSILDQGSLWDPKSEEEIGDIDEHVVQRLIEDVNHLDESSRAFYLIMLDAPHHDYSWARDFPPRFVPFMAKVPLLSATITGDNVGLLRARYQNAVSFDDFLLGRFLAKLKERNLLESSIIVVTGDHGEEFLEEGHLVHSSALNGYQLRVPIMIYIPDSLRHTTSVNIASHTAIFPTIFDVIGIGGSANTVLDGRSMVADATGGLAFCAMCSSYSPSKLLVDAGDEKVQVEFEGIAKIGTKLIARRLVARTVFDSNYREMTGRDTDGRAQELIKRLVGEVVLNSGR